MSRRPRSAALAVSTVLAAALGLGALSACATTEQLASAAPDNVAAPSDDAAVSGVVDDPAEASGEAADTADGIEPAPGATPEAPGAPGAPPAFQFAGTTIDGEEFEGADLAGRPVVLWFWAPWCSTCRNQIDQVRALTQAYGDTDVAFVGVGGLDDASRMKAFADDVDAPAMTQLSDPEGIVWRHFGTTAQSTFLVIDGDGSRIDSGFMSEADLNAAIKTSLS